MTFYSKSIENVPPKWLFKINV